MNHAFLKDQALDLESIVIETKRCILKPFSMEVVDFTDLQQAFVKANENLYISPHMPTVEEERAFIAETIENRKKGKGFECFVFDKTSGTHLGVMGINGLETDEPNIGLWLRTEHQGKGYGTEVYRAMLDWARQETNFTFFKHATHPENIASIKLAEKFKGKLQDTLAARDFLKYYVTL